MSDLNYAQLFKVNKRSFLKGDSLLSWELETIRSFVGACAIRQTIPVILFLLTIFGFFGALALSGDKPWLFVIALICSVAVQLLLLAISFFYGRSWPLRVISIMYVLPFIQSISIILIGASLFVDGKQVSFAGQNASLTFSPLLGIPQLFIASWLWNSVKRATRVQEKIPLTNAEFAELSRWFSRIGSKRTVELWYPFGTIGHRKDIKARFFQNVILLICGQYPFAYLTNADANNCVITTSKKSHKLKQWPVGFYARKVVKNAIALTSDGHRFFEAWRAHPFAGQTSERTPSPEILAPITCNCPSCGKPFFFENTNASSLNFKCPSCSTNIEVSIS